HSRRAAQQDRRTEAAVDRRFEASDVRTAGGKARRARLPAHAISAPPPKLKKERKKLDAANAIDRPKMIWIRRLKPPLVSPKASVRPVTMMMITAMILATGP